MQRYLEALETADRTQPIEAEANFKRVIAILGLPKTIAAMKLVGG